MGVKANLLCAVGTIGRLSLLVTDRAPYSPDKYIIYDTVFDKSANDPQCVESNTGEKC